MVNLKEKLKCNFFFFLQNWHAVRVQNLLSLKGMVKIKLQNMKAVHFDYLLILLNVSCLFEEN